MSDQPPFDVWKRQGQPEYPPQQAYGQQAYAPEQPTYSQQDLGQDQDQPGYRRTGQQPSWPSFTPNPQYGAPPGQSQYQGQPQYPPGSFGQQPYPQGQPPYGQQPYPGSGSGPQPPRRRRKRHLLRNTLAVIGGLVVAGIAISVASAHSGGVSTTPSGSSSTAGSASSPAPTAHAATARVGSYFDVQAGSGDTYRVTLAKIIDPAQGADQFSTPDPGQRFVGVVFAIKALRGSPQNEDANSDAAVVGSNGQTYTADFDNIAGYTNFSNGSINVAQGDTTTGVVVFQVPDGVKVTEVQWTTSGGFGSTVQWDVQG